MGNVLHLHCLALAMLVVLLLLTRRASNLMPRAPYLNTHLTPVSLLKSSPLTPDKVQLAPVHVVTPVSSSEQRDPTKLLTLLTRRTSNLTPRADQMQRLSLSLLKLANFTSSPQVPDNVTPASSKEERDPPVVLTRDLYMAGHKQLHPELCPLLGANLRLVVLVTSTPSHTMARDAVRLTWGHYAARKDMVLAFVLGAPPSTLRTAIDAEDALYGDMIVGRYVDSYSNRTLKTLSMLEWVDTYCPRVPHLLKTDDDVFINIPHLLEFSAARANTTRTIWGNVERRPLLKRITNSKHYVSPLQYPARVFLVYVSGHAYLLTTDCVRPLLLAVLPERYLRSEDVFVTGVLATRLGLRRLHVPEFYAKKVLEACAVQHSLSIHMVPYHEQFDLWSKLLDGKANCKS